MSFSELPWQRMSGWRMLLAQVGLFVGTQLATLVDRLALRFGAHKVSAAAAAAAAAVYAQYWDDSYSAWCI